MKSVKNEPVLTIEQELAADKGRHQLRRYERQMQALRSRVRSRLDRGLPKGEAQPFHALLDACDAAKEVLPRLWHDSRRP